MAQGVCETLHVTRNPLFLTLKVDQKILIGARGRGGGRGEGWGKSGGGRGGGNGGGGGGGGWRGGDGGTDSWGVGVVDGSSVNAFLTTVLTRVMRVTVPISSLASASVLHSAVGGSVVGVVGPL